LTDEDIFYENLKMKLNDRVGNGDYIEKLGLLEKTPVVKQGTPIDTLSYYLSKRLVSRGDFEGV
jgi:alpha-aminoadipic semialdehyde synthase